VRDPTDPDHPTSLRELGEEGRARLDLLPRRRAVRARGARVGRNDVPEQNVACDPELRKDRVDDRGGRLGRACAGELTLRGQRYSRHARPTVSRRFGDEQEVRVAPRGQVGAKAPTPERRARVLVERLADPRGGEPLDKAHRHPVSVESVQRRRVVVQGRVQGVFFRETTRRRALAEGITGWVHNQPDGSVEAVLEGERDAVERLVAFLREGPRGARVDWVDVASEEPEGLSGFETR
jgi:acylphosphatase